MAKLAGAPEAKAAGIELLVTLNSTVKKFQPLFKIHAETQGQLHYALDFFINATIFFKLRKIYDSNYFSS
ncbi:MAG: hypothetical protein QM652_07975 [Legionella sp.]